MAEELLAVTIGPVQEMIAQARRTRDLWYGSLLLSELSRSVAQSIAGEGTLVFPKLAGDDLVPKWDYADTLERASCANRILAILPAGRSREAAIGARKAVFDNLMELGAVVRRQLALDSEPGKSLIVWGEEAEASWVEQLATLLEFYAAWAPLPSPDQFGRVRSEVEGAVDARKRLREFGSWKQQRAKVPKSSLDGAHDTMLSDPDVRGRLAAKYRIPRREQLDALGLIKRCLGKPEPFVPVANVALAGWIKRACTNPVAKDGLLRLASNMERLGFSSVRRRRPGHGRDVATEARQELHWTSNFPADAQMLLPNRWKSLHEEAGTPVPDVTSWGRDNVRKPVLDVVHREPHPYVACLVADGDRIGGVLAEIATSETYTKVAQRLDNFAAEARRIVEEKCSGSLVYAGGDDVLAFVSLSDALCCAALLRATFEHLLGEKPPELKLPEDQPWPPTLSVGIGIGHLMDSMGDLLDLGRRAEKLAKGDALPTRLQRDALALLVDKRSGGEISWRQQWGAPPLSSREMPTTEVVCVEQPPRATATIEGASRLLDRALSKGKVYEVRQALRRFPHPRDVKREAKEEPLKEAAWCHALRLDVVRTLSRTRVGEVATNPVALGLELESHEKYEDVFRTILEWVNLMLVALEFRRYERSLPEEVAQ